MNIFQVCKNISLNVYVFVGYLNLIWQIMFVKQILESFSILKMDSSAISGITMLSALNFVVGLGLFITFLSFSFIEYLSNRNAEYKFNETYKNNKLAIIYFYCGLLGNILPIILSLIILKIS